MALVLKIFFTSLLICTSLGTEINVSFELEDSGVNEVIFVKEKGIVLRCCVSGVSSEYMIRIKRTKGDDILPSAQNETCENCLEYIIEEVSIDDGGEYTCKVSYSGSSGSMETETKILNLNVHDGKKTQCFRNGTTEQPYQVNDLVLMSCYCRKTDETTPCMWTVGIPALPVMNTFETINRSSKKIQRLLIQVGSESSSLNMIYICRYSSIPVHWCTMGPQSESSTDVVINSHNENTFTDSLDCELLSTSTVTLPEGTVTQKKITNQSTASTGELTTASVAERTSSRVGEITPTLTSRKSNASTSEFNVIVIGVSGGIGIALVLIIIIVIIVVIFLERKKSEKKETGPQQNQFQDNTDQHGSEISTINGSTDLYYDIDIIRKASQKVDDSKSRDRAQKILNSTSEKGNSDLSKTKIKSSLEIADTADQNTLQNGLEKKLYITDIPDNDYAVVKGETDSTEDSGDLYAKVDKNRRKSGNKMSEMKTALAHHNASDGGKDFGALYAKVDKNRQSTRSETDGGKVLKHEDDTDMYAAIDEM